MQYLSDEWFVAADKALVDDDRLRGSLAEVRLSIEQTVTDAPEGTVTWSLTIDHGTARLAAGPADDADVRLRTTWRVANDIARGRLAAPAAFLRGDLSVGGDLNLLTSHQRALATVDDVLADVRRATTFD